MLNLFAGYDKIAYKNMDQRNTKEATITV